MKPAQAIELIRPGWPSPENVGAAFTTRRGGVSPVPYQSLNLAMHVGDDPECVAANRRRLRECLGFDAEIRWLHQVHGVEVANAGKVSGDGVRADAWVCFEPGEVCGVLTADCLPVFLCDRRGSCVGLVHAGWRGLSGGVIEATVAALDRSPASLLAWLGPAISAHAYQVGDEVRDAFASAHEEDALAFVPDNVGAWRADLCGLAVNRLRRLGVACFAEPRCTFYDDARFYSYRRDGRTGRMASLIWLRSSSQA